ncbi:pirin family protein [uncultured Bacteroides sp.]|uniref:pirin family protein n=1 Tax=uncultured Bacteroides sp. TaxID=162156 RepID=UPI002675B413|nr:pirin family protein [uncultured Bacteroides sp.]
MKKVIDRASSRGYFNHGWLKTHHTFSFANYYNPERIHFGALRVLNDDSVAPSMGFDTHPHKNMEVVSIPLKGYLRHGDSIQNTETITPGDIQVMSAGNGIYHSEYNGSDKEQLEFLQIWVFPRAENTKPEYNNFDIRPLLKQNELSLILSPDGKTPASIKQDAWFSIGNFDMDKTVEYKMHQEGNGAYIFIIEGEITVAGERLSNRDGIGIWETKSFPIRISKGTRLLLMEVPM